MVNTVPLYVIGLSKDEPVGEFLMAKFGDALKKVQPVLSNIIEAKIAVETQNPEGSRTHYEVRATVTTAKNQLVYTESGWDIFEIINKLCRKLEGELPKHETKRQRESIRKKGTN